MECGAEGRCTEKIIAARQFTVETNRAVRSLPSQNSPKLGVGMPFLKSLKMIFQPTGTTQSTVAQGSKIRTPIKQISLIGAVGQV